MRNYLLPLLIVLFGSVAIAIHYQATKPEEKIYTKRIKPLKIQELKERKFSGIDTTARKILLIGDSQAYFFMKGFKKYTDSAANSLNTVSWVSATIDQFAQVDTLSYFLKLYKPNFVIVLLGTNQLPIKDSSQLIKNIYTIEKRLKNYYSVWIGPLKRRKDIGLNELLEKCIPENRFFRSDKLTISRKAESWAHPNNAGSRAWADTVAQWIMHKSKYHLQMKKNTNAKRYDYTKLVLKPLE